MTKLRVVKDAYELIKASDPATAMTLCGLRRLVQMGTIPSVQIGKKKLVNYEALIEFLNSPPQPVKATPASGQIRKAG